jgi:hypothetical protein
MKRKLTILIGYIFSGTMVTYARDDERRRIRVSLSGYVTLPELIAIVDRQASEGTWMYGILYDTQSMDEPPPLDDMQAVLAHVRQLADEHGPRGPVAIVARSADTVASALMYAHRAGDDLKLEVFWDTEDAELWLDQQTGP